MTEQQVQSERWKRSSPIRDNILLMLGLNIVPLIISGYFVYGYLTGTLKFSAIPKTFWWTVLLFVIAVGVVSLAAWGVLPAAVALRKRARLWFRKAGNRFRGKGGGKFAGLWYGTAGGFGYGIGSIVYLLGWVIFAAGIGGSIGTIVLLFKRFG